LTDTEDDIKSCPPPHVLFADLKLEIAVLTNAVDDALVELSPAVFVGTIIELLNVFVVPVHVLVPDNKLFIAVLTNAVDAAFVEFSDAVFVNTVKSYSVDAEDRNDKLVSLPIKSVITEGQVKD
jgi:hypothetical protein